MAKVSKIVKAAQQALAHAKGDISGCVITCFGERLRMNYDENEDCLEVTIISKRTDFTEEELNWQKVFDGLSTVSDEFGEPIGLKVESFRSDNWHLNRNSLKIAVVMHFDESEREAHLVVDKLFKDCHF